MHTLNTLNEHADPLTYPLIHIYGEKGWCPDLEASSADDTPDGTKLGACDFYTQRLMVYDVKNSSMPYAAGRLCQQYIVDKWICIETQRLDWCRKNQDKLRMESLQGLMDYISNSANDHEQDDAAETSAELPAASFCS